MNCTKFKFSLLLIVLMAILFTGACKKGVQGEFKPKLYYTITGEVMNLANVPLQDVRVEITDYTMIDSGASKPTGVFATLSDADGVFTIELVSYDNVDAVSLKFSRNSYTPNYLNVGVTEGQTVEVSAVMASAGSYTTVDFGGTDEDSIEVTGGGASVTISRGTLVNAAGAGISSARVSVAGIDTTADRSLLPGSFYGMDGDALKIFSTFGMIELSAIDGSGDPVNLKSGATADISIPLGDVVGPDPASTVGLWYYNEENAQWVREGLLTYNAADRTYEGTVSHFSIFNAGKSYDVTYIKGSVVDQTWEEGLNTADSAIYGAEVSIFQELFSNDGLWQTSYTSGPEGNFPSILNTGLSGIVPPDKNGYIPVPADTELNIRIKYIKPSDKSEFVYPDPDNPEETGKFTTGAAGEATILDPVQFLLETSAFVKATVFFDNGQPATGNWLYFRNADDTATIKYTYINADGNAVNTIGFTPTTNTNINLPSETDMIMKVTSGPPTAELEVYSWFMNGNEVPPFVPGSNAAKLYTTGVPGTTVNHEITLLLTGGGGGETSIPHTYVSGIAKLADGSFAPEGSWLVFKGTYGGRPVVVRAQVGADGVFPDPNGNFYTEEIDGAYYVALPAETDWTVEMLDVLTDPVNPDVLFTYDYTSGVEDDSGTVTMGPNTTVSGTVYYGGGLGTDLLVTFTLVDAVTECAADDTECEVDVPVTVITDTTTGAYTVALEIDREYRVTVSTHEGGTPLDTLKTVLYTSMPDAEDDPVPLDITIGAAYMPVATVAGRVVYDGALGIDLLVTFTKTIPIAGDEPFYAYTDGDGRYSADLEPATQYTVTVSESFGGAVIYPSEEFPGPGGGELLFTSSDFDSNITGEIDKLDIQIGAGLKGSPYTLYLPDGAAGVGGTLLNSDGTPAAIGTLIYFLIDGGNPQFDAIWAIVNDAEGTYFATGAGFAPTKYPVALDPDSTYSVRYLNFSNFATTVLNEAFMTGGAGVMETVLVAFPAEGEVPSTDAYVTGTLKNADGTPAAIGTLIYFLIDGGNPQFDAIWAIVNDVDGTYFATGPGFAATADPVVLAPDSVYSVRYLNFSNFATTILNDSFMTGGAGVQETVLVAFPAEGEAPSDDAYVTGTLYNADGTPAAIGTLIYFLIDGGNPQFDAIWAIVADADGNYFATGPGFTPTTDPIVLAPESTYSVRYLNFSNFATTILNEAFISGSAGVKKTLFVAFPQQ